MLIETDPWANEYLELLKQCLTASLYDESAWHKFEPGAIKLPSWKQPLQLLRALLKRQLFKTAAGHSLRIVRTDRFDPEKRAIGRDFPLFGYTMIGHRRLDNIRQCLDQVLRDQVPGDLIETGAWRGGSTIWMRALLKAHAVTDRCVWVADSFEGLPAPTLAADQVNADHDLSNVEFLKVSVEQVQSNFARFGLLDQQVKFLKGWFRDTLPTAPIEKLAILRLDGDLYESTWDALEALYDRVSPGGFVIVDDYQDWEPCRRAVTDFRGKRQISEEIQYIDSNAVFWRVSARSPRKS